MDDLPPPLEDCSEQITSLKRRIEAFQPRDPPANENPVEEEKMPRPAMATRRSDKTEPQHGLKKVQASIADAAKRLTTDSDAWLSPELLKAVMANPSLAKGFADPRYQRVLRTMQENPEKAKREIAGDTDLAEWLRAFSALMSRHFEKLASESSPVPSLSPAGNTPSGDKNEISVDSENLLGDPQMKSLLQYLQSNPQAQLDPRQLPPQLAQKVMHLVEKGIVKLHA
ncbi:hypothetical protein FOZ60_008815 [Perkinsus olseni]|uniref:STI1/HOP DP domain-containing protein n=1 Tax=Perkinsus olseni TaxID=32597 RepID=A0A7J6NKL9_PEROL|nr:hypothetical protein FOZ60_008815 [Perkinsus olseni]KAF4719689.1 hypothetical protein FOZ62_000086 [Perkinsus olseni]